MTKAPLAGLFLWLCSQTALAAPQRIVTLSPHAAELVCAAGGCDRLVGVVEHTDFPPRLKSLPSVGNYVALNVEAIAALKPDLIITWQAGNPSRHLDQLRLLGMPLHDSSPKTLQDIPNEIRRLGELLGTSARAEKVAALLDAQLTALKANFQKPPPISVFYQIWHRPLITVGAGQFITQAISLCGGWNIFADQKSLSLTVNVEAVIVRNPEVILIGGHPESRDSWRAAWQRWPDLKAVGKGNIYFVPPDLLQRPGPRLIAGTALLCYLLEKAKARR